MLTLSVLASLALMIGGLILLVFQKKAAPRPPVPPASGSAPGTPPTSPTVPGQGSPNGNLYDEGRDIWQIFGLVDDAPNGYRAVVSGPTGHGRILYYIADTDRVSTNPLVRNRSVDLLTLLVERITGKRVFGLPFITSLRDMDIDRVVKRPTLIKQEVSLFEQIEATGVVKRKLLYREIYRPTYHEALDTKDQVRFNVNSDAVINVTDPEPAYKRYQHSFLQTLSDRIGNYIASQVNNMDWETYKAYRVGDNKFDLVGLNQMLTDLGVEVIRLTVSDYEIAKASPEVQAALQEVKIAERQAEAQRRRGEGERDFAILTAEGRAKAIERLAKAEAKRFDELFRTFRKDGKMSEAEAIHLAQQTIVAEVNAEAIGKLTTYAPGNPGGVQLSVPVGEKRK